MTLLIFNMALSEMARPDVCAAGTVRGELAISW
jgi:hypothetical protein